MQSFLNKKIEKNKNVEKIAKKEHKKNKDVLFLFIHDPILKGVLIIPFIMIGFELINHTLDLFMILLWLFIFPLTLWFAIKHMPMKTNTDYEKYEKLMPKRTDYKSKSDYYAAYLRFIWYGAQGKYK